MIRRSTWIVLAMLLALVGFSFYLRERKASESASATPTNATPPLFEGGGEPTLIRVEGSQGVAIQLSREGTGKWVLNAPREAEADQAAAEAAATQAGALRVLSTVQLGADIIGLDHPDYTLTLAFGDSVEHKLRIGSLTPIQDGYYAQLDDGPYQVVDKLGLDELIGLQTAPPYPATATPEASATPSAVPAAATPEDGQVTNTANAAEQASATATP